MSIRILHIATMLNIGGIETLLMNIYRKIDRNKVQFDFLVSREEEGVFDKEIELLGGRIYKITNMSKVGYYQYTKNIYEFLKQHAEYKIVHCHRDALCSIYLKQAKRVGIPVRIAHSHTIRLTPPKTLKEKMNVIVKSYFKLFVTRYATEYFACSEAAGEWLFGKNKKNIKIIKNGIDINKYVYSDEIRKKVRENLKIQDRDILIGHVGSFTKPKNHEFLLDLFEYIKKHDSDIRLVLVGYGPLEEGIKNKVQDLGLEKDVLFLGMRRDINELMMAMDIFVFPSLFEGLGIALVEAQTTGITCLASTNVPKEVDMGLGLVKYLEIDNKKEWAKQIYNDICSKKEQRKSDISNISARGYDINQSVLEIEQMYLEFNNRYNNRYNNKGIDYDKI